MSNRSIPAALLTSVVLTISCVGSAQAAVPHCFGSRPTIVGTAGDDTLVGTDGPDVIFGRGGSDTIRGLGGNDRLCGGGAGFDQISGGRGRDLIEVAGYDPQDTKVQERYATANGGAGHDRVDASGFWTIVRGNSGNDSIHGDGVHLLFGDAGKDLLIASDRPSTFFQGGSGDDRLVDRTGTGVLVLWEAPRPQRVDLGAGSASGWGQDTLVGFTSVLGSEFDDVLQGSDSADYLEGRRGDDRLVGRTGDDKLAGNEGADRIFAGPGDDEAAGTLDCTASATRSECHRPDRVQGGAGADVVSGGEGDDQLVGGMHNDTVIGGGGHDLAHGGSGNDYLHGYGGDDRLFGEDGEDVLSGYWSSRAADAEKDLDDTDHLDGGADLDRCFAGESYVNCEVVD